MKRWLLSLCILLLVGCGKADEVNVMQAQLAEAPFTAQGSMEYQGKTFAIEMKRAEGSKILVTTSEKLPTPVTYTLQEGALLIDHNGEDVIKLEEAKAPETCVALQIWDGLEALSLGSSVKKGDTITVTRQDRAVATASKDKKLLSLTFAAQQIKISFNSFEYL